MTLQPRLTCAMMTRRGPRGIGKAVLPRPGLRSFHRELGDSMTIIREERIGNQRLILGDCLQVMPLLGKVDAVVTDPPYELSASGPGTAHHFGASLAKFDSQRYRDIVSGVDYTAMFFSLSFARSYILRRAFDWLAKNPRHG